MKYQITVGLDVRVVQTDDSGRIEYIDGVPVEDIDEFDISEIAKALARHQINEGYRNSQDIAGYSDFQEARALQKIDEMRGK